MLIRGWVATKMTPDSNTVSRTRYRTVQIEQVWCAHLSLLALSLTAVESTNVRLVLLGIHDAAKEPMRVSGWRSRSGRVLSGDI